MANQERIFELESALTKLVDEAERTYLSALDDGVKLVPLGRAAEVGRLALAGEGYNALTTLLDIAEQALTSVDFERRQVLGFAPLFFLKVAVEDYRPKKRAGGGDIYYFVVFEHRTLGRFEQERISNIILKNIHPVTWATHPPEGYVRNGHITYLHFWQEIPELVAMTAGSEPESGLGIEDEKGRRLKTKKKRSQNEQKSN